MSDFVAYVHIVASFSIHLSWISLFKQRLWRCRNTFLLPFIKNTEVKHIQFFEMIEITITYTWMAFTYKDMAFLKENVIQKKKNKQPLVMNASVSFVSGAVSCSLALYLFPSLFKYQLLKFIMHASVILLHFYDTWPICIRNLSCYTYLLLVCISELVTIKEFNLIISFINILTGDCSNSIMRPNVTENNSTPGPGQVSTETRNLFTSFKLDT